MTFFWIATCLALMAGTYLGRALPFWFPWIETLPAPVKRFLDVVPAAALGALILPDAFIGAPAGIAVAVVVLSLVLTLRGVSITTVVILTIALAWAGLTLFPV